MRPNKLLNLLARNAKRGEFRAEGNTIFLYDVIVASDDDAEWFGGVSAQTFTRTLTGMSGPVHLRINSPGGDVFASRAMAQAMREYSDVITAHVDGYAASAASLIAVSASRCIMAPGSFMMIHKAWTLAMGNSADFLATAALLDKIDGSLAETYAAKTGKPAPEYADLMAAETWFTAAEAVAAGLADEQAPDKPQTSQAQWNLSAYDAPPAEAAADPIAEADPVAEPTNPVRQEVVPDPVDVTAENERRSRLHAVRMLAPAA